MPPKGEINVRLVGHVVGLNHHILLRLIEMIILQI